MYFWMIFTFVSWTAGIAGIKRGRSVYKWAAAYEEAKAQIAPKREVKLLFSVWCVSVYQHPGLG